jgi:mono/diheme cytochrome c family protein
MKRVLKWLGIIVVVLVVLVGVLHFVGKARLEKAPEVATRPVTVPTDAEAIARGEHLANDVSLCVGCHGADFSGDVFLDGEIGMYVAAPNLTSGQGGVGATLSDADWERAIRHGVGGNGRTLVIMPSNLYSHYSDEDMGALIAYLKQVPAVDSDWKLRQVGFPGSILGGIMGYAEFTHIGRIDHEQVGVAAPAEGATAEFGEYLSQIGACRECHGPNLAGNFTPDTSPMGPNLTPSGELQGWAQADFVTLIRTGVKPTGTQVDTEQMPWDMYSRMTDVELEALWAYLQSLPALPNNPE